MASFVDRAPIQLKAGDGGNGAVSFHREKYVQKGGPDGGDGGKGGDVVLLADHKLHTLLDFRYQRKIQADNGMQGSSVRRSGKSGEDLGIKVPVGTLVKLMDTGAVVADMFEPGQRRVLLQGGRGGWGNAHFATPTRQAPSFAKPGIKTRWHEFVLELRTMADVGLVGYPNAGKSSLLARVTAARPKVADYPFTTLTPNLGIASHKGTDFAIADIPGLIEGASEGAGLGFAFLRHVERTRILLQVVDASGQEGREPGDDLKTIDNELARYGGLEDRVRIVVANKMDLPESAGRLEGIRVLAGGRQVFPVSAATGEGMGGLMDAVTAELAKLPPAAPVQEEPFLEEERLRGWEVGRDRDGAFLVSGNSMDSLLLAVNFDDFESMRWFHRTLRASGVIGRLREMGAREGDTVRMGETEFDFVE